MIRVYFLLLICFTTTTFSLSQNSPNIESLISNLRKENVDSNRIKLYLRIGVFYSSQNPVVSKLYLDSGYNLAKEIHSAKFIAVANVNYGYYYYYTSDFTKALECNLSAIKYFEGQKDTARMITPLINIGLVHFSQKHYKEALAIFNRAMNIDNSDYYSKNSMRRLVMNNIANVYWKTNEYELAKIYYKRSIELGEYFKDNLTLSASYTELGELYLENGRMDSAYYYIIKGIDVRKQISDTVGLAGAYKSLSKYYLQSKEYSAALENLQKAMEFAEMTKNLRMISEIYHLKSIIYQEQNNYKQALEAYQKYKDVNDSVFNEKKTREIAKKELQYEFDKKEKIAQIEREQAELMYFVSAAILFLFLIIAVLLYFLSQSRNKRIKLAKENLELDKKNLEKDLEIKNKELTTNIMYLLRKNELINHISDRLLRFKINLNKENQEALQNILSDLQSGTDEKVWEEFEYRFSQVHNDFYDKLLSKYPDLTPSEKRLCAFLRLNISSKDISAITHQNIKSIEVARSRLRKKLNISNMDVNLVNFLMEI